MAQTVLLREKKYLWAPFWGVLFFVMMVLGTAFWVWYYALTTAPDRDFNGELVAQFAKHKENTDMSVVMLGNSRLRHATHAGYSVEDVYTLPDGRTVTFLQFAKNSATLQSYERLLPQILHLRPDVLVLQDSLVSTFKTSRLMLIDYFRAALDFYIDRFKGLTPHEKWSEMRHTPIECRHHNYDRAEMDAYLDYKQNIRHTLGDTNPNYVLSQGLVHNALTLGTRVITLRLDPNVGFFKRMDVPLYRANFHGLGREPSHVELLPDDYGRVAWWHYTETEADNYCDMVHVNAKGATKFTKQLLDKIATVKPR